MADSLVQNLVKRTIGSLANITGVRLWSGKTGEPDALGVEMSEMISSAIVAEASTLDYKGLTPKGFAASVATEARKGISALATDEEIAAETANKALEASDQAAIRLNSAKAYGIAFADNLQGRPKIWQQDGIGEGETEGLAYKFTICYNVNKPDTTQKAYYFLPFVMPAGKWIRGAIVNGIYAGVSISNVNTQNAVIDASSIDKEIQFGSNDFKIVFPASTAPPYILNSRAGRSSCTLDIYAIVR